MELCPLCGDDEDVVAVDLGSGLVEYRCQRTGHDGGAFVWTRVSAQLSAPDRDAREGTGLAAELGMYDDLPQCLVAGEPWVEYGIIERRYREACPDAFAQVFTTDTGRSLVPDSVTRNFREAVATLALPRIRLHDLRHTHATLMLQAGVPVKVVSERLGHASAQLTMDIYAHVLPAMDSDAADRFALHVLGPDAEAREASRPWCGRC